MVCFFDLPLPIREQIYRYALVKTRIFVRPFISMEYVFDANRANSYGIPTLSLLCASRQIHKEANPIYLGENIFSVVQIDILAAASRKFPGLAQNLKKIRHLELIFDSRDYIYLAQFLSQQLPTISEVIEDTADDSIGKLSALQVLDEMHARFPLSGTRHSHSTSMVSMSSPSSPLHDSHIENMKEYLWGRTLTFIRQMFRLSQLQVDLRRCTCSGGCCRLAGEVLRWGWFHVWVHGMPAQVLVRGASSREKEAISRIFGEQRFYPGPCTGDLYDKERAVDAGELDRYDDVIRGVHQKLTR
ncbi:hypothetical protein EYZ11_009465 [Aspergillus tanneri]|uniref:Uncharacterized protein n=1 Tax=Aspergillus tanneri TaxID=1220188 RepID=A0A4S3J819_9EURO|nr:uncharacterized protein ATNIH1004_000795 [Aspergillus tanneri]KAA8651896.1 hypothetical protein ATNIH1004_000795 [Aspergillus tanneri]THC91080.1 hypothetical protein EYZ11_009465 [Aspergillus tanneri]